MDLNLGLKVKQVELFAIFPVFDIDAIMPGSVSWRTSVSIVGIIMLNSVRACTHPCFTAFVTGMVDLHHQVHKHACSCGIGILYKWIFQDIHTYSWSSKAPHDLQYRMPWLSPQMRCEGQHFVPGNWRCCEKCQDYIISNVMRLISCLMFLVLSWSHSGSRGVNPALSAQWDGSGGFLQALFLLCRFLGGYHHTSVCFLCVCKGALWLSLWSLDGKYLVLFGIVLSANFAGMVQTLCRSQIKPEYVCM